MSFSQNNIKIGARIMIGFGTMIAIIIGFVFFVNHTLDVSMEMEDEYVRRSNQVAELLEAKAAYIEIRRAVVMYLLKGGETKAIDSGMAAFEKILISARDNFRRLERKERMESALKSLRDYKVGLEELYKVREDKDAFPKVLERMAAYGQSIQNEMIALTNMIQADLKKSNEEMDTLGTENERMNKIVGALSVILGLVIAYFIGRGITLPIKNMTAVMGDLANGNLTVTVPNIENKDEIGQMARAVEVFKENAIKVEAMRKEQAAAEERAAQDRRKAMLDMADRFEASVMGVVKNVSSQASEMQATARSMSDIASKTSQQATAVAAASTEASTNVETVASATEELSASTGEIGNRVTEAANVSQRAADESARTNEMVQKLLTATNKIGEVVDLINAIAAQTNLLALNATIEAARAGDAGKGFAVVAGEVKSLASQTAKATDEIGAQINAVQAETNNAVAAIKNIAEIIAQIRGISANIASAVEEQGAATKEIARNVQQAAAGTHEVSSNIVEVTNASTQTGAAAEQVLSAAGELAHNAENLRHEVESFLANIRAG